MVLGDVSRDTGDIGIDVGSENPDIVIEALSLLLKRESDNASPGYVRYGRISDGALLIGSAPTETASVPLDEGPETSTRGAISTAISPAALAVTIIAFLPIDACSTCNLLRLGKLK